MPLSVRPALPQDKQFLYEVSYGVMAEKLHAHLWAPSIRHNLLDMQVRAQEGSYGVMHPNADYAIIMLDDERVGRLIIDRSGASYYLVDISVMEKRRGAGIGTRVVLALCMEAQMMGKNVQLHVSVTNPRAAELYKRLGFRPIEQTETDTLMERTPADQSQVVAAP